MRGSRQRTLLILLVAGAFTSTFATAATESPSLRIHADAGLRANAVYHLACLGGTIDCTKDLFEQLWRERLGRSAADDAAIDAWRQTFRDVSQRAPARPSSALMPNTPGMYPSQAARNRLLTAILAGGTSRDLRRESADLLSVAEAERLSKAIAHIERRIKPWWRVEQRESIERRKLEFERLAGDASVNELFSDMARFLEATAPSREAYVHLITAPSGDSERSAATLFGNHFVVETVNSTTSAGLISVGLHELTHYLYDRAPADRQLALIDEFTSSGSPAAVGTYAYLNEAIASAVQEIYGKRIGTPKDGAYAHPYIQPLADATAPLLSKALDQRTTLFAGFAPAYIAAGTTALADRVREPRFQLAQVRLMVPDEMKTLASQYAQTMYPGAMRTSSDVRELTGNNGGVGMVVLARYDSIGDVGAKITELAALREHRGFAYAIADAASAVTYVLAGRDQDAISDVLAKFAALSQLPAVGVVLSID